VHYDQFVVADLMIDEIRVTRCRDDPNVREVAVAPDPGKFGKRFYRAVDVGTHIVRVLRIALQR